MSSADKNTIWTPIRRQFAVSSFTPFATTGNNLKPHLEQLPLHLTICTSQEALSWLQREICQGAYFKRITINEDDG